MFSIDISLAQAFLLACIIIFALYLASRGYFPKFLHRAIGSPYLNIEIVDIRFVDNQTLDIIVVNRSKEVRFLKKILAIVDESYEFNHSMQASHSVSTASYDMRIDVNPESLNSLQVEQIIQPNKTDHFSIKFYTYNSKNKNFEDRSHLVKLHFALLLDEDDKNHNSESILISNTRKGHIFYYDYNPSGIKLSKRQILLRRIIRKIVRPKSYEDTIAYSAW